MKKRQDLFRYKSLVETITDRIKKGEFLPGEKLPSVRRLSQQEKVSVSTVLHAYEILEARRLVRSVSKKGYYIERLPELSPEPRPVTSTAGPSFVDIGDTVMEILSGVRRDDLVPFAAALPAGELLPAHALNKIMARIGRQSDLAPFRFERPRGSVELRRQLSRYAADWGCHLSPDDFIITNGCLEALSLALRASVPPGGVVGVESPAYYGVLMAIEGLGLKAMELPAKAEGGIDTDKLEKTLKTGKPDACLVTANFSNPSGHLMPDDEKEKLARIMARYNKPLIEDDIYGDLYYSDKRPLSLKSFDRDGMILLCSSFTKTLAPGYRTGYIAPGRYLERVEKLKFMSSGTTHSLGQQVIAGFMATGGYDRHLKQVRNAFAVQTETGRELISRFFPEGTGISRPEGGFVLWVELPGKRDSYELYRKAMPESISFLPGHIFSSSARYKNCLRISCGSPWSEKHVSALSRLGELAGSI